MTSLALFAAVALAVPQATYVRSRVDAGDKNAHCLWWEAGTVTYQQNVQGNPDTTGETEFGAISASFKSWDDVLAGCGGLRLQEGPRTANRTVGHDIERNDNQNVVLFRTQLCSSVAGATDPCWAADNCMNVYDCWAYAEATIALTTTTYDRVTGKIYGADVEFNAAPAVKRKRKFVFTTVEKPVCIDPLVNQSCVSTDVQNTMTHEVGHLLGLDHSSSTSSTMYFSAPDGELTKRTLDADSRAFLCEAYPAGRPSQDCVVTKFAGSTSSAALGPAAGCSAVAGVGPGGVSLLVAWMAWRRRRTSRRAAVRGGVEGTARDA